MVKGKPEILNKEIYQMHSMLTEMKSHFEDVYQNFSEKKKVNLLKKRVSIADLQERYSTIIRNLHLMSQNK